MRPLEVLQISFLGAIDWAAAGVQPGDWAGLQGSDWASAPLLQAVTAAGFAWFSVILLSDAALSPAATGWVWLGIGTRTVYSMSVNRELPTAFQRINRYGTPIAALRPARCSACSSSSRRRAGTSSSGWSRSPSRSATSWEARS